MTLDLASIWSLVRKAGSAWIDDYAPSMGAALSYYTVFSLAPMLLIVIGVAGLLFGDQAARGALFGELDGMMGPDAAAAVQGLLANASKPAQGVLSSAIGVAVLLVGATSVFGELQDSLDRIWRVPARDKAAGLWALLRSRLLSFGMILGIAFLLMVSLVVSAVVAAVGKWWGGAFGEWELPAQVLTFVFGFVVTAVGFALIYKLMPRADVQWRDVWIGAFVTSFLFSLGRFLISLYVGKSGIASSFGAAGSLVLVFVWVYYSAQIFLLGAEFTWAYATTFGSRREEAASTASAAGSVPSRSSDGPGATSTDAPAPAPAPAVASISATTTAARSIPATAQDDVATLALTSLAGGFAAVWALRRLARHTAARFHR